MPKRWLVVLAGCAHPAPVPVPPPPPVAIVAPVPAPPKLVTDRVLALGGGPTWATADDVRAIKFCPGDEELVVREERAVRRYRVADGAQLAVDQVPSSRSLAPWDGVVDCRVDGTLLVLDEARSPVLIDRDGKRTAPPAPIESQRATFAPDGAVLVLAGEGVQRWQAERVELVVHAADHALYAALADGGVYVERVYAPGKPEAGLWMTRNGVRTRLPGEMSDVETASAAPDGAVALGSMMIAYGWTLKGKVASKGVLLLDQGGSSVKAALATNRFFIAVDAGGSVWDALRPKLTWDHIDKPCGSDDTMAVAVAGDDKRIAVACSSVGIRIFDIMQARQLSRDPISSAAMTLAWSPDGDRLATRADNGTIRVWRGAALIATIRDHSGASLWWRSATELAGPHGDELATFTLDGEVTDVKPRQRVHKVAHGAHGELIYVLDGKLFIDGAPIDLTGDDWIDGIAISDGGTRATAWRGKHSNQPGSEVVEIDVAKHLARTDPGEVTTAAVDDEAVYTGNTAGELIRYVGGVATRVAALGVPITAIALGREMIAVGDRDGRIAILAPAGKPLGTLAAHTAPIRALAWSPTGQLASTAGDGTKVWTLR